MGVQLSTDCARKCPRPECKYDGRAFCWRSRSHKGVHKGTCGHEWN